ncbi:NUDIX domain-containing protein [Alistipes sp. OttesenSCG-928-L06]|nr:NUDIX domain-containing protein [Alistipes sp. OttesenSCG-928-L06]
MYKLYFSDRVIILDNDAAKYDPAEVFHVSPGDASLEKAKLLQKIQNTKRLVYIHADVEALYRAVTDQFASIEAGGGLVTNRRGEILMIFRHNRWDLPKGKLESGECIDDCAVREVEEETGITPVALGRKLLLTTHFYRLDGEWVMKKTHWYAMAYDGDATPVPQIEEDITAIEWASPGKLDHYLRTTYPTIIDVFEAAGFRIR